MASRLDPPSKLALTTREQFVVLRDLTERTGALHEAQATQLRLWPFMVDKGLEKSDADVDITAKTIRFRWRNDDYDDRWRPSRAYEGRLEKLDRWVKFLLGQSWTTSVLMNATAVEDPEKGLVVEGGIAIFPLKETASARQSGRKDPRRTARSSARKARRVNRRRSR